MTAGNTKRDETGMAMEYSVMVIEQLEHTGLPLRITGASCSPHGYLFATNVTIRLAAIPAICFWEPIAIIFKTRQRKDERRAGIDR